jgi:hypothetical protein
MSYMLLDKVGYVGDLASARGLRQLYEAAAGRPAALKFIESGEIESEDEKERLLSEVDGDPRWNHVRAMLSNGQAPFVITDGASSSAEGEVANVGEFEEEKHPRGEGGRWTSVAGTQESNGGADPMLTMEAAGADSISHARAVATIEAKLVDADDAPKEWVNKFRIVVEMFSRSALATMAKNVSGVLKVNQEEFNAAFPRNQGARALFSPTKRLIAVRTDRSSTLTHEITHSIDWDGNGYRSQKDPEWKRIWHEEIVGLNSLDRMYAQTNVMEGVACAMQFCHENGFEELNRKSPKVAGYLKAHYLNPARLRG